MTHLKENEEKRSRKEEREKQQQQRLATPSSVCPVDNSVDNPRLSAAWQHAWQRGILEADLAKCAALVGMSAAEVNDWLLYMESVDWKFSTGGKVTWRNFRRSLRMWHKIQERIDEKKSRREENRRVHREQRRDEAEQKRLAKLAAKPESWALCIERCAFARECGGCTRGVKVPPAHQPRPIPPEECEGFVRGKCF